MKLLYFEFDELQMFKHQMDKPLCTKWERHGVIPLFTGGGGDFWKNHRRVAKDL